MPPKKELNRHQLSSKLSYSQSRPAFIQKLHNRIAGIPDDEPEYDDEFEDVGDGRVPIPRRPAIPERPADDPGSADEDGDDEKPQIVVLKAGKHLTAFQAENERRIGARLLSSLSVNLLIHGLEKGLPPLLEPRPDPGPPPGEKAKKKPKDGPSLSFSSSGSQPVKKNTSKRKINVDSDPEDGPSLKTEPLKKKAKKKNKTLLSFGDDA